MEVIEYLREENRRQQTFTSENTFFDGSASQVMAALFELSPRDPLIAAFEDEDSLVREHAARALAVVQRRR